MGCFILLYGTFGSDIMNPTPKQTVQKARYIFNDKVIIFLQRNKLMTIFYPEDEYFVLKHVSSFKECDVIKTSSEVYSKVLLIIQSYKWTINS